jgi:hypothetical protein
MKSMDATENLGFYALRSKNFGLMVGAQASARPRMLKFPQAGGPPAV